ncbi:adenylyl-sulfate kinase [Paenibacillus mucilaginosus]|uniref:adenylyl-sulfate kinase n=1 Tax=Paenibacillus mucilaginosus TaxID=61624 RepID=UPI001EEF6101|nr:adenylyl-sulfate kinase [Paenibacillus mucilaginosus]MCG7216471.1 adenylyl-sulfate kinase [Paenibacillus mucilaginosus]
MPLVGTAIWLTGLPSSGKTTTAIALTAALKERGIRVECLDGDELRREVGQELGFGKEDRLETIRRAVYISKLLNRNGVTTIISMIAPYMEMRNYARAELESYVEVYLHCPLAECERRDVKGLYAKARKGEIAGFTGVSDVYEPPVNPEITIHTLTNSVESNVRQILDFLVNDLDKKTEP